MTRIHINASTPYDVVIEEGALQRITDYIKPLKPNCRVIIVSDSNVAPHYLDSVKANMEHAGYDTKGKNLRGGIGFRAIY